VDTITIDEVNNPFPVELFGEITALNITSPFLKPRKVGENYITVKLQQVNPATPKSYEEAKASVTADYTKEQNAKQLQTLALSSLADFKGKQSGYITPDQSAAMAGLNEEETKLFVSKLFASTQKRGYVPLSENKFVLFNITDQKLAAEKQGPETMQVARLKASIFDRSLIKMLESRYAVESYVGGN